MTNQHCTRCGLSHPIYEVVRDDMHACIRGLLAEVHELKELRRARRFALVDAQSAIEAALGWLTSDVDKARAIEILRAALKGPAPDAPLPNHICGTPDAMCDGDCVRASVQVGDDV